ncbi:MAG TPA: multiheme c-type cytochrome [Acidobacteriaceae bacterium]|nr:multiheme c-type cytochrome [Acidobacteriaceae bacterium]
MGRQSRAVCTHSRLRSGIRAFVLVLCIGVTGPEWHFSAAPVYAGADTPARVHSDQRANYVGDDACRSCHADRVESFHQTAHSLTSRLPDEKSILGSFAPGQNVLRTGNAELFFQMDERRADGKAEFFQTAVAGVPPHTRERSEQFAYVIGSGGKGQTYLYWDDDQLFELPVSYWRTLGWVNSPGYRDGFADFDRPIIPRCLECHATSIESQSPPSNRYSHAGFVAGIQCEKCHGPGKEHVQRETANPGAPSGSAILNPARFSRERQMDLCAWCHAGQGDALLPVFSYIPGEPLGRYIRLPQPDPDAAPDVHDNQVAMLRRSRCFQASGMTCLTCHDVHAPQHDLAEFSQRCLTCHKPNSATFARSDHPVTNNCIDCHMPKLETNLIVFNSKGSNMRPEVRSHWIKVYAPGPSG